MANSQADRQPVAVIDIGSNSVRLVVYEGASRYPMPLFNEKATCGLGRKLSTTGELCEDAIACALRALGRFRAICNRLNVVDVNALATEAVREARNGRKFIEKAEKICDAKIDMIVGEREAELASSGVACGFHKPHGLVADMGGGSLEIAVISGDEAKRSESLKLGGLRLLEEAGGDPAKAAKLAAAGLAKLDWLKEGKSRPLYLIGGTWRALARLHIMETGYPLQVIHSYRLNCTPAMKFCKRLMKPKALLGLTGIEQISAARQETLPFGAALLAALLERVQPNHIYFSVYGIREGLLYERLPDDERKRDPLLAFCEDFAILRSRSLSHEHGRELCRWSDQLLLACGIEETETERRLRHAACLVSDIGWRSHRDYRAEKSLIFFTHQIVSGIDHSGIASVALASYFRHVTSIKSQRALELSNLLFDDWLARARLTGLAVRAAHMLSLGMPGALCESDLLREGEKLVWRIPSAHEELNGDRMQRRFSTLARHVGLEGEIRFDAL